MSVVLPPLPCYPSAATRKSLSASQLAATRKSIAAGLLATAALPPTQRDTPAARNFVSTYAKDQARIALDYLIWDTPPAQDEKLIRKRTLILAEKLADGLDLQTLVDLAIIYARTNPAQIRAVLAAGLESTPLKSNLSCCRRLRSFFRPPKASTRCGRRAIALRLFLHYSVCPKDILRVFAQSKDFIVALATAYDTGLATLAHSYGGLSSSDSREADEWERIWVETKVSLVDAFHSIVRALLDDMVASSGAALAVEVDRTFDIVFTLLSLPSSSQPNSVQTPFLDRSLLADYQQTYDLSRTLASSLRHAEEKDARLDLLESSLQSLNSSSEKEPGVLKILLRSSGMAPGVGKSFSKTPDTVAKGKEKAVSSPAEDPELDFKVTQVLDILPEHDPGYIRALLTHSAHTTSEKVVEALLEGTAPSPEALAASAAPADEISSYVRRNVFDDEDMDLAHVRVGKKTEDASVLRDRTFIEQMKADILRRAEEISDDEEDEEAGEGKSGTARGKAKELADDGDLDLEDDSHIKVAGDGEESGGEDGDEEEESLSPETICELAYIRDPKLFDRDAETRRGKARADLKAQTGWTNEQLEGWRIMLERNPKKDKILQKHEFAGNQNEIAPETQGGESSRGGPPRGGGRGRGGRGGRGNSRGRGGGGGGGDDARERAWKDKNKASRGNHNRKRGHDKKMARAGGPS
ncbi:CUE domain-containing protein [Mycena sanguinolenta]|uniref:CUE domain-containing protein n=1 Tax=Mycena sanguinolenta TaxID=230812 RepID=A0A8H6XNI1_9AGAR|nr:CUE domain-containing protein [Mycena sanguinolenta]